MLTKSNYPLTTDKELWGMSSHKSISFTPSSGPVNKWLTNLIPQGYMIKSAKKKKTHSDKTKLCAKVDPPENLPLILASITALFELCPLLLTMYDFLSKFLKTQQWTGLARVQRRQRRKRKLIKQIVSSTLAENPLCCGFYFIWLGLNLGDHCTQGGFICLVDGWTNLGFMEI